MIDLSVIPKKMKHVPLVENESRNTTGECVGMAVAQVTGMTKEEFYASYNYAKKQRCTRAAVAALNESGKFKAFEVPKVAGLSLWKLAALFPHGYFIVRVRSHALAIKDGAIYDHCHKPTRVIKNAWLITKLN